MLMKTRIRQFEDKDYPSVVEIQNVLEPDDPIAVDELRYHDEHRDPKCKNQRWVAELDGRVVAYCQYDQSPGMYHPRKFSIHIGVHPEWQRKGIGSELYDHVIVALQQFDPISVRANAQEDKKRALEFLGRRGFREQNRMWESRLDVASFDPSPYAGLEEKVLSQGMEIKTFRQLEGDKNRNRKLYDLGNELMEDVPTPEPITIWSFDYFLTHTVNSPHLLPDGYFVAVYKDEYVGTSNLWAGKATDALYTGFTGVRRAYRHRGVALTLKLRGIAYAKKHGHPKIITGNDSLNKPMLSINERLGFVKQPVWIGFVKIFREE